jgi:hypothetical protein
MNEDVKTPAPVEETPVEKAPESETPVPEKPEAGDEGSAEEDGDDK